MTTIMIIIIYMYMYIYICYCYYYSFIIIDMYMYIYVSPLHHYIPDEFLQAEGSLCGAGGRASFHRLAACERRGKPPRVASRFINHH